MPALCVELSLLSVILTGLSVERGYAEVSNRRTEAPPTKALVTGGV